MRLNLIKTMLIAGVVLLSGCAGVSTSTCLSEGCKSFDGHGAANATKVNVGGSGLGSSFSQYSSGLLHD